MLDLSCTYRDASTFIDDLEVTPDYTSVLNVALVQSRDTMVLIGTVNIESMKAKIVHGVRSRNRTLSIEVIGFTLILLLFIFFSYALFYCGSFWLYCAVRRLDLICGSIYFQAILYLYHPHNFALLYYFHVVVIIIS